MLGNKNFYLQQGCRSQSWVFCKETEHRS